MAENNVTPVISAPVPMTPFQEFWHYFKQNKGAVVGLIYIVIMLLIAGGPCRRFSASCTQ